MRTSRFCLIAVIAFGLLAMPIIANAAWETLDGQPLGEGIDYQMFVVLSGFYPASVHVTRMPIGDDDYAIQACSAFGAVNKCGKSGRGQTILDQIPLYDGAINSYGSMDGQYWYPEWGKTSTVYAAINGGPHNTGTEGEFGVTRGHIQQGIFAKRPDLSAAGLSGFIWGGDRMPYIGGCLGIDDQKAHFGAYSPTIAKINAGTAEGNELVMFTPQQAGGKTPLRSSAGKEVVVRMPNAVTLNGNMSLVGTVWAIGNPTGETYIPFDCIVLSGSGDRATELNSLAVEAEVTIDQNVTNYKTDEQNPGPTNGCVVEDSTIPWHLAYSYVGGFTRFLDDGDEVEGIDTGDNAIKNYRTAVAYDDDYVYFVTATYMNVGDLADFCRDTLSCTDGISLDNGPSTQMWVKGQKTFTNAFAQWLDRGPVADGLMMCKINEAAQSPAEHYDSIYTPEVPVTKTTWLRTGPGKSYPVISTVSASTTVTTQYHTKNGIRSQEAYWWYVDDGSNKGWINESALSRCYTLVQPVTPTVTGHGGVAHLDTRWKGNVLSRQWYQLVDSNWVAVEDEEDHISGATTDTLSFQDVDYWSDLGYYRCKCTSYYGVEVYSNQCYLLVIYGGG